MPRPDLKRIQSTEEAAEVLRYALRTGDCELAYNATFYGGPLGNLRMVLGETAWELAGVLTRSWYRKGKALGALDKHERLQELGKKLEGLEGSQKAFLEVIIGELGEFLSDEPFWDPKEKFPEFHVTERRGEFLIEWVKKGRRLNFSLKTLAEESSWSFTDTEVSSAVESGPLVKIKIFRHLKRMINEDPIEL